MYDTGFWGRTDSPGLGSYDRWRAWMAFNNFCLNYSFQIELVPILRSLLQHRIQICGIGDDLARCFSSLPQDAGQDDDGFAGNRVMKPGDDGVVARETFAWNLPLKRPDLFRRTLAIHYPADVIVIFKPYGQILRYAHRPGIVECTNHDEWAFSQLSKASFRSG